MADAAAASRYALVNGQWCAVSRLPSRGTGQEGMYRLACLREYIDKDTE